MAGMRTWKTSSSIVLYPSTITFSTPRSILGCGTCGTAGAAALRASVAPPHLELTIHRICYAHQNDAHTRAHTLMPMGVARGSAGGASFGGYSARYVVSPVNAGERNV
jgi:hypothetical protein